MLLCYYVTTVTTVTTLATIARIHTASPFQSPSGHVLRAYCNVALPCFAHLRPGPDVINLRHAQNQQHASFEAFESWITNGFSKMAIYYKSCMSSMGVNGHMTALNRVLVAGVCKDTGPSMRSSTRRPRDTICR